MMDVDWLGNEIVGLPHARQSLSLNMLVVVVAFVVVTTSAAVVVVVVVKPTVIVSITICFLTLSLLL